MSVMMITKSVRLTPDEAQELARAAQQTAATESALMKKLILEGLQAQKLDRAIQFYMRREVDLRGGAALAGVSYNRFLRQVQARHIVILEDQTFLERLYDLAETFENLELQEAIREVEASSLG
jgi:hypothetical protein